MGNKFEIGRSSCGGGILGDIGNILGKKKCQQVVDLLEGIEEIERNEKNISIWKGKLLGFSDQRMRVNQEEMLKKDFIIFYFVIRCITVLFIEYQNLEGYDYKG